MYNPKYYFTFYADRDTRIENGFPDEYLCRISQLDYEGEATEIQAQQNPVQITYQNTSSNKLEPIIGSEATLNLIATEDFQLEDLYTENEREFLVEVFRKVTPNTFTVTWSLDEAAANLDLEIFVNGVRVVNTFVTSSGSFEINNGDEVLIKPFAQAPAPPGINGLNLEVTGLPTQRTTVYPLFFDTYITPTSDITISAYTTYSATEYTAINSAVFETTCPSGNGTFEVYTEYYTSTVSQAAAQALADADTGFNASGQAYADAVGTCYVGPYDFDDLIWTGFIIPDGCQEAFTFAPYPISVNAVDGLGLLKNLSYCQNDGNFYIGKQSFIEVIEACLVRLEAPSLVLNTCVNIYETSMTQGNAFDPLALAYVNSERYLKDDQFTPMNCEEVLKSILEEWTAVMIQSGGEWYIYRPTELALSGNLVFRRYLDGDRIYDQPTVTTDLDCLLGGESEGLLLAPFFHINTDQMKMIDRPYKNASMSYKYGKIENKDENLANPNLQGAAQGCGGDPIGPCDDVTIPGYTKTGTMYAGLYPGGGVIFYNQGDTFPVSTNYYENDNTIPVDNKNRIKIVIEYINPAYINGTDMNFIITLNEGLDDYYLNFNNNWVTSLSPIAYSVRSEPGTTGTLTIISDVVPITGLFTKSVSFKILAPTGTVEDIVYTRISGYVLIDFGAQVGEIHTATQDGKFTFVPPTIDVFNGDSPNNLYVGAIFEEDETTLTQRWVRRGISESILAQPYEANKEFLRIAVEEKQRLYAGPFVRFEGSIFGYFPPLTRWTINLITGYFMNLSLTYDLQQNICKAVLGRVANEEIAMDYEKVPDYGTTTKVTVKGS